jgi:hypothetical protein
VTEASLQSRTPPSENLDAGHEDDVPLTYRRMGELLGPRSSPGHAIRNLSEQLFLANGEELATFKQVEQEESWRMAMADEFNSIVENDT